MSSRAEKVTEDCGVELFLTDDQVRRARSKLQKFFPELFRYGYAFLQYRGFAAVWGRDDAKKSIIRFAAENAGSERAIKAIAMDFGEYVPFRLQITARKDGTKATRRLFPNPDGAHSNYFMSIQPALWTAWAAQSAFYYTQHENAISVEIPHLKRHGMGMFIFEQQALQVCENADFLHFEISFDYHVPKNFTVFLFR